MFRPDVLVEISYCLSHPEKTVIRTNARKEALEEIISSWIQDQMGRGSKETGQPAERETYLIRIGLRIADDAFGHESDTGNHSLTVGLVLDVLRRLETLEVAALS